MLPPSWANLGCAVLQSLILHVVVDMNPICRATVYVYANLSLLPVLPFVHLPATVLYLYAVNERPPTVQLGVAHAKGTLYRTVG